MAEQKTKCVCKNIWFWVVAGIIVVLGLGGFFYYKFTFVPCADPSCYEGVDYTVDVKPEELPAGVEVTNLENGNRLVKNINDGYQIEVGSDKYLYKDSAANKDLAVQDFPEPTEAYGGMPGCRALFEVNEYDLSNFDNELKQICDELKPDCESYSVENITKNNLNWVVGKIHGSFLGTDNPEYHVIVGNKTYNVYFLCSDENFIESILNNFFI